MTNKSTGTLEDGLAKMKLLAESFLQVLEEDSEKALNGKYAQCRNIRQAVQGLKKEGNDLRKALITRYHESKKV